MRRTLALVVLLLLSACGGQTQHDVIGDDGPYLDGSQTDAGTDAGNDVFDTFDAGRDVMPDIGDVNDTTGDEGNDAVQDVDLDAADVRLDVPVVCTAETAETDCAGACGELTECHVCGCNTDVAGGQCEIMEAVDGAECQDGENCTRDDYCENGTCLPGRLACDCIDDEDCALFEDDTVCNGTLFCNKDVFPYECAVDKTTIVKCPTNENTQCSESMCDPETGECAMQPANEGETCTIVSICVLSATCQEGLCAPFVSRDCNDDNPCTDDDCVDGLGCVRTNNSEPCDDNNVCTTEDTCAGGSCGHLSTLSCDNGVFCDGVEDCDPETGCKAGTPPTCDDGNACTQDRCLAFYDECFNDWLPTATEGPRGSSSCSDGKDNDCDGLTDISDPDCLLAVDRIEPADGVVGGGDEVVLVGNELDLATYVTFGGVQAEIVDGTGLSLTVITPPALGPGAVDVVVGTDLVAYTFINGFTYTAVASVPGGECLLTFPTTALERDVGASIVVMTGQSLVPTTVPSDNVKFHLGYGPRGTNPTITPGWMWTNAGMAAQTTVGGAYQTTWSVFPVAEKGGYFDMAARLSTDGGVHWTICDLDGSANGYSPAQAPDLTVYGNADPGDVIINEMMWTGTADEANDEWIELRNVSAAPIRLTGWKISGVGYPAGQDFMFDASDRIVNNEIIDGGGYYLIAQFDAAHSALDIDADMLAQDPSLATRTLRLPNTGPRTYNLIDDREIVIDSAYFSAAFGMVGSVPFNEPYRSMERRDGHATGTTDGDWQSAWIAEGWDGDPFQSMLMGTPRAPNSGIATCDSDSDCQAFHPEVSTGLCQARICDPDEGRCAIVDIPDGDPCDDGLYCTVGETCTSSVCGNSSPRDCTDSGAGSLCTIDTCDDDENECVHTPDTSVREGPKGDSRCNDLIDNDCDGTTDGQDPQCLFEVTSITPDSVPQDAAVDNWTATISGAGFQGLTVTGVSLYGDAGEVPVVFAVNSDTSIGVTLPSMASPGVYDVRVTDGLVTAQLDAALTFQGRADDMMAIISSPTSDLTVNMNQSTVYIKGRVKGDAIGTGTGMIDPQSIIAEVGYGPELSDPTTDHGWTWLVSAYDSTCVDCVDEYQFRRTVSIATSGYYDVAYRFSVDGGVTWAWGPIGPPYSMDPWDPDATITIWVRP